MFSETNYFLSGASTGIGFAVAEALAKKRACLWIASRDVKNLERAKASLLSAGASQVHLVVLNLENDDLEATLKKEISPNVKFDGILLNGGGPHGSKIDQSTSEDMDRAYRLLLRGPSLVLKTLIPFCKKPGSSVVAITSTTVKEPNPSLPMSAAFRTALVTVLKNWADLYGAQGIRFNNVAPGYTLTERLNELADHAVTSQQFKTTEETYAAWAQRSALKRNATPEEIAKVVLFLFSNDSSYITGQTLFADGGSTRGYL